MATWFSYDPNDGFEEHDTREEAQSAAIECIPHYLDEVWDEEVERVCWGLVAGHAQRDVIATAADESDAGQRCRDNGWDEEWEYPVVSDPDAVALIEGAAAIEKARREGAEAMREAITSTLSARLKNILHPSTKDGLISDHDIVRGHGFAAALETAGTHALPPGPPTALEDAQRELAEARAELARLRPVVEAARRFRSAFHESDYDESESRRVGMFDALDASAP